MTLVLPVQSDAGVACMDGDEIYIGYPSPEQTSLEVWDTEDNTTVTVYLNTAQRKRLIALLQRVGD